MLRTTGKELQNQNNINGNIWKSVLFFVIIVVAIVIIVIVIIVIHSALLMI
jgi:hypothetical protein